MARIVTHTAVVALLLILVQEPCSAAALAAAVPPAAPVADPTLPPPGYGTSAANVGVAATTAAPEDTRLQMILLQGKQRSAVVGGRTVHVGDTVQIDGSAARVERINDSNLVLRHGAERVVLNLVDELPAIRRKSACTDRATDAAQCRTP